MSNLRELILQYFEDILEQYLLIQFTFFEHKWAKVLG